jgi:hypothetical protein
MVSVGRFPLEGETDMDLTTIEKPFGLLDEETKAALQAAYENREVVEYFVGSGWVKSQTPTWGPAVTYRARPTPKPPAIELPWEVIDSRWGWVAMDSGGCLKFLTHKPRLSEYNRWSLSHLSSGDIAYIHPELLKGVSINVTDWQQSLTKRPEGM